MPVDPTPVAFATERHALARLFIDLSLVFRDAIPRNHTEPDANLTLITVAVVLGHAGGFALTEGQIAEITHMPRPTVRRRLQTLLKRGMIMRVGHRYYIEPVRAKEFPIKNKVDLILAQAFEVLGPYLINMSA